MQWPIRTPSRHQLSVELQCILRVSVLRVKGNSIDYRIIFLYICGIVHNEVSDMHRNTIAVRNVVRLLLPVLLLACSEVNDPPAPIFQRVDPTPGISDQAIWDAAYGGRRTPDGFYFENLPGSLYYVNTVSITPQTERENTWFEVCTDDSAQARAWIGMSVQNSSGNYVRNQGERQTGKYFEIHMSSERHSVHFRVHRRSYLDAGEFDRLHPSSSLGKFTLRPITSAAVQELIEYLWFIRHHRIGGVAVLSCETATTPQSFVTSLTELHLAILDGSEGDPITLLRHRYTIDRSSGEIQVETTKLEEFIGRN